MQKSEFKTCYRSIPITPDVACGDAAMAQWDDLWDMHLMRCREPRPTLYPDTGVEAGEAAVGGLSQSMSIAYNVWSFTRHSCSRCTCSLLSSPHVLSFPLAASFISQSICICMWRRVRACRVGARLQHSEQVLRWIRDLQVRHGVGGEMSSGLWCWRKGVTHGAEAT